MLYHASVSAAAWRARREVRFVMRDGRSGVDIL